MTLPPPKEWRDGTPEQQAAFQGFKDGRHAGGFDFEPWREISRKCLSRYSEYHDAGHIFRKQDNLKTA